MYCPECRCEYTGPVMRICPGCRSYLLPAPVAVPVSPDDMPAIPYEELLRHVDEAGGQLSVEVQATRISRESKRRFPYLGYGFAWAAEMAGVAGDLVATLEAANVGRSMKWSFPYQGFGYAWVKEFVGQIAGHAVLLTARKVQMKRSWSFPYFGYGYAWTEELTGECGDQLSAHLRITDVGRDRRQGFPYVGFGYAWERAGVLTLERTP